MAKKTLRFLYRLTRTDDEPVYDCADGFVISAINETEARAIAAQYSGDEGASYWIGKAKSELIGKSAMLSEMVLRDYHAG